MRAVHFARLLVEYALLSRSTETNQEAVVGKPSKGTKKDRRLRENKRARKRLPEFLRKKLGRR